MLTRHCPCAGDLAVIGDSAKNAELTQFMQSFMQSSSDFFLREMGTAGVGGWGGSCTCPDGTVYQVGDYQNGCASIACINGISGECGTSNPGGANVQVTCAVPPDDSCGMYAWLGARDCDAGTCSWVDGSPWVCSARVIRVVLTLSHPPAKARVCKMAMRRSLKVHSLALMIRIFISIPMEHGVPGLAPGEL